MSDHNSLPIYSYPDEVVIKWKTERDAALAEVERLRGELERIKGMPK